MGLQYVRPKFIAVVVCCLVGGIIGESHGSFLMKDLVDGMKGLTLRSKPLLPKIQRRSFATSPKLFKASEPWIQSAKQVFGRPTYDATVKKVLANDEARLDFIRTFAKLPDVVSTQPLDVSLNPIRRITNLKELFKAKGMVEYMENVQQQPSQHKVMCDNNMSILGSTFLWGVAAHYGDLLSLLPMERDSDVDILCRLSTDEYVLVEVQVKKQNYWDKRALAYASAIYGNQLREGQEWEDLKKLVCINVLGGGPDNVRFWPQGAHFMRHYIIQDQKDPQNVIPELQLIQYSLENVKGDEEELQQNKNLKDWLDYFKNAQDMKEIPSGISTGLHKAYELSMRKDFSAKERALQDEQDNNFSRYSHHIDSMKMEALEEGIEKGKTESAMNLLAMGIEVEKIAKATGLSEEIILSLKTEKST
jgi:predicted transposase/invertase (TIGR01784 family)